MENVIYLSYKTKNLTEEANCTEPSAQLVFPVVTFK